MPAHRWFIDEVCRAVLELERVGVRYGEVVGPHRGDAIDRAEVVTVLGANGAGKSPLFDVSLGLRVNEVFGRVDLAEKGARTVEVLSGGERQRPAASWSGWSDSTLAFIVRVCAPPHGETA